MKVARDDRRAKRDMIDKERDSVELRALQRVAQSGARALDLDVVLARCLEQSMKIARAEAGVIYLRDQRRNVMRKAVTRAADDALAPPTLEMHLVDRNIVDAISIWDLDPERPASRTAWERGFRRAFVLRFMVDERRVGFMALLFHEPRELHDSTRNTLLAMAGFEAVAIEAARVHHELYERARVANLLRDFGERALDPDANIPRLIVSTARAVAGADRALLATIHDRGPGGPWFKVTHALGYAEDLTGVEGPADAPHVAEALSHPLVIEDATQHDGLAEKMGRFATRSFVLVTMRKGERPIGQIFAGLTEPHDFSDAEVEGMELFSTMAATALERARRADEERVQHERLAAVIEHLPIVVAVVSRDGNLLHLNAAGREFAARVGGKEDGEGWRESFFRFGVYDRNGNFVPPEERLVTQAFAGTTPVARELTLVKDDLRLPVLAVAAPLTNADGHVDTVVTAFQDVSQLRNLADAKDRFLSIASHELRSPITSLRATTSLLQMDPNAITDEARRTTLFQRIQRQIDRLATLVERLLDTARLNAGELPLDYADCELVALCKEAIELAKPSLREHTITLEEHAPLYGRWDPARVEQVITNLLSNALRYSPPSEIRLVIRQEGERACVDVIDQGVGIAADDLPNVFTPFFRGAHAAAQHKAGLGLGLYITHEIARRHGGSLKVQSKLGQGSTFTVELPLAPRSRSR
jgi:signal transduction histidine kinase